MPPASIVTGRFAALRSTPPYNTLLNNALLENDVGVDGGLTGLENAVAILGFIVEFEAVDVAHGFCATGNGMELDAIAGVYIGGTSSAGGVASVSGSVIGAILLVVIRSGLNMVLAKLGISLNSTYVTYVLTGIIVVVAILMDIIKTNNQNKVKIEKVEEAKKEETKA